MRAPVLFLLTLAFFSSVSQKAHAYSSYIRLGYVQCQACHQSSLGGGMLNPYGKGIADANSLVSRMKDEDSASEPSWLQGSIAARHLWMKVGDTEDRFLMQLDAMGYAQFSEKFSAEISAGLVPEHVRNRPNAPKGILGKDFVLRKATSSMTLTEESRLVFGREHLPRALNIDDHTSFLRSQARQNPTDFPTQLRYELASEAWVFHGSVFAPSYEETETNREYGLVARAEKPFAEKLTLGALALYGESESIRRSQGDIFVRYGFSDRIGVQADLQFVHRTVLASKTGSDQWIFYARPFIVPLEWIEAGYVAENYDRSKPFEDQAFLHGPNLYFKLLRELTLILDARFTHREGTATQKQYLLQLFAQI